MTTIVLGDRFSKQPSRWGGECIGACVDLGGSEPVPTGDPNANPSRQHAWREYLRHDEHGNSQLPKHQVLPYINFDGDGQPSTDTRSTLERALTVLDRAYEWSHESLLHSIAYSPSHFERVDKPLPENVELLEPRALSPFESPRFDTQDAVVHLASDCADVVLEAGPSGRARPGERRLR